MVFWPEDDVASQRETNIGDWPLLLAVAGWEQRAGGFARARGGLALFGYEFLRFGLKQGWACLFGGLLLMLVSYTMVALA